MNRRATAWAWAQHLTPPSKLVLLALATAAKSPEHAVNLDAIATLDQLATRTGLSRRAVRIHLRRLEQSHHVVVEERVDETGRRLANRWHLNVDGIAPVGLGVATTWQAPPPPPDVPPEPPAPEPDPDTELPVDWSDE